MCPLTSLRWAYSMTGSVRSRLLARSALLAALLLSTAGTGFAEVLALQDGQTIKTKGPWTLDGRRITYTALNGTFSALRTSLVDLEKSRELSEQHIGPHGKAVAPPKPKEPAPVGLVVRQNDIRSSSADEEQSQEQASGPAVPQGAIGVSSWDEVLVTQGTQIVGTLRNATVNTYITLRLEVTLIADNGDALATKPAKLEKNWLNPSTELPFEITFPEVFAFTDATFEVDGSPLEPPPTEDARDASQEIETTPTEGEAPPPDQGFL